MTRRLVHGCNRHHDLLGVRVELLQRFGSLERSCRWMDEIQSYLRPAAMVEVDVVPLVPSFEDFYVASFRRLFTALCLVTGNCDEAEEVAQEAFVRVYERWERIGGLDDPTGYLFRVAMNVARSQYRRASLGVRRALTRVSRATDDLAAVDAHDAVVRLLRGLDPKQRAAVVLTAILDFSAEEAGEMLGMRASSIRALTTRARAHMKHEAIDP